MIRTLALSSLVAFLSSGVAAQTTLHYREGQRVEPQDVMQILNKVDDGAIRTRSIRVLQDEPVAAGAGAAASAGASSGAAASASALSLPVQFEFDSTTITAPAREQLDALAEGIKLLPQGRLVLIEGHTDASGPDDYNQALSLRRAAAVKRYLVQAHGIEARRLRDAGFGKRRPIAGTDPHAPENRRVQFRGA
jgi:outer membrane protein OmpA-like peptidoglycan-associated protein